MTEDKFQIDLELEIINMENSLAQLKEDLQSHIEDSCDHIFAGSVYKGVTCDKCEISIEDARNNGWPQ